MAPFQWRLEMKRNGRGGETGSHGGGVVTAPFHGAEEARWSGAGTEAAVNWLGDSGRRLSGVIPRMGMTRGWASWAWCVNWAGWGRLPTGLISGESRPGRLLRAELTKGLWAENKGRRIALQNRILKFKSKSLNLSNNFWV
jgi:hypothetical protein